MYEVVQIRLREAGKITYFSPGGMRFKVGEYVIVEADRGLDYGQIVHEAEMVIEKDLGEAVRKIIRKMNPWDDKQADANKKKARELFDVCEKKIAAHKIDMKLIEVEYQYLL